jgi:hypothetical protein
MATIVIGKVDKLVLPRTSCFNLLIAVSVRTDDSGTRHRDFEHGADRRGVS